MNPWVDVLNTFTDTFNTMNESIQELCDAEGIKRPVKATPEQMTQWIDSGAGDDEQVEFSSADEMADFLHYYSAKHSEEAC
jgi:hypothetical protein